MRARPPVVLITTLGLVLLAAITGSRLLLDALLPAEIPFGPSFVLILLPAVAMALVAIAVWRSWRAGAVLATVAACVSGVTDILGWVDWVSAISVAAAIVVVICVWTRSAREHVRETRLSRAREAALRPGAFG